MKHSMIISLCVLLTAGVPCACSSSSGSNDADGGDLVDIFPDAAEDIGLEEMADDGGSDTGEAPDAEAEAECGNGALEPGEQCDDGNDNPGDGCENDCTWTCENDTTTGSNLPVDVPSLTTGVGGIAAGRTHTCAVLNTGGAKCWGSNFSGQLGDSTTLSSPTPVDVAGMADADEVAAGGVRDTSSNPLGHSCTVSRSGGAMCWGNNSNGQLGDGTTVQKTTPAQVVGLTANVTKIAAGGMHTCALMEST